mmetsp:Transcript_2610/g.7235  ORF Transcript_2610/g.7235 Transcript_2610/m.7235 type:complete len:232 (-) Transcript_2610:204-899(-)
MQLRRTALAARASFPIQSAILSHRIEKRVRSGRSMHPVSRKVPPRRATTRAARSRPRRRHTRSSCAPRTRMCCWDAASHSSDTAATSSSCRSSKVTDRCMRNHHVVRRPSSPNPSCVKSSRAAAVSSSATRSTPIPSCATSNTKSTSPCTGSKWMTASPGRRSPWVFATRNDLVNSQVECEQRRGRYSIFLLVPMECGLYGWCCSAPQGMAWYVYQSVESYTTDDMRAKLT